MTLLEEGEADVSTDAYGGLHVVIYGVVRRCVMSYTSQVRYAKLEAKQTYDKKNPKPPSEKKKKKKKKKEPKSDL